MNKRNRIPKSTEKYLERKKRRTWSAALYARLSDENNGFEDDRSLRNQINYLESYLKEHPELKLWDIYTDNGRSGLNFDRAEFQRMLEDIREGKVNCVLVKDLSRFGRNHIEAGYYLETIFPEMGVRFISVNDGFDSLNEDGGDSLILPLKNMINEMYARETQRKVLAVLRAKEKVGERPFAMVPYGYKVDPGCNYHLLPDENTSCYVRLVFSMKASGCGLTAIADRLNEIGAPTPLDYLKSRGKYLSVRSSGRWDYISVQQLLSNRTYTGSTVYNTTGKGDYMVIPNTHEPFVDVNVFEKISQEIAEKGRQKSEALKKAHLRAEELPNVLKGKFFCGNCGRAMLYDRAGSRNFRYRCSGYNDFRKTDPDAPPCAVKLSSIPEQVVRRFVLEELRKRLRAGCYQELFSETIPAETAGIINLSDTSSVEIVSLGDPDEVEHLLRKGLTRELVMATIDRLSYSVDGTFTIKFRGEDE
ncbi:MAG: recombinase family protein [Oscillospiraceae bacterium]|nr:recombinase family protein [Oscillospiraceae bacterium]